MRKRTTFLAILLCLQCLIATNANNPVSKPEPQLSISNPCTLPPPAHIFWSFPNSTTVLVSWTAVPGAWGYYISFTGNAFTQSATTTGTSVTFTVAPNQLYLVSVYSKCDMLTKSDIPAQAKISTSILIADVILDHQEQNCTNRTEVFDLDTVSNKAIDFFSDETKNYYLQFKTPVVQSGGGALYDLFLKRVPSIQGGYKFQFKQVAGQASQLSCLGSGLPDANGNYLDCALPHFAAESSGADVQVFKVMASAFGTDQILITNNTFDSYKLFYCGGRNYGGGDGRDNGLSITSHSYAVSPFHDYLQIGLDPSKRLKSIRMMDISGRLTFSQTMPDDMEFSEQLILPTEQLAQGLYILQLQSTDGKVEIFKVVKE